jgi:hypothetical protein
MTYQIPPARPKQLNSCIETILQDIRTCGEQMHLAKSPEIVVYQIKKMSFLLDQLKHFASHDFTKTEI